MSNTSLTQYGTQATPQSQPIPGRTDQVKNSAGGYVFAVDKWSRLNRWLILGSEGGSYYASERKLTFDNLDTVMECINEDGPRTVSIITDISQSGRAPKNDQALFALAMCASAGGSIPDRPGFATLPAREAWDKAYLPALATRAAAFDALPKVARIATHLFQFITYMEQFRNWGAGMRRAIGQWYTEMDPNKLALQLVKYRSRTVEGSTPWSHRDVLRKVHIDASGHAKTDNPYTRGLLAWATRGEQQMVHVADTNAFRLIEGFEKAQKATTPGEVAGLISTYNLPRECVPTELLSNSEVYAALLPGMGLTALIRNLATMTRIGLLNNTSAATKVVIDKLSNGETLRKARVHPMTILFALKTYEAGFSVRGSNTWSPVPRIVDALDDAFYASFDNVPATGKSRLIALDVSGSMDYHKVGGLPTLTARVASSAMAMVSIKTGDPYEVVAFTGGGRGFWNASSVDSLTVLSFSARQRLDDICRATDGLPFGGTDCSLPALWATKHRRAFDVIEIYTDNETWAGNIHPSQALQQYRQTMGLSTKQIVVGMTSNGFTIADPNDPAQLDVVGFDTSTPAIMSAFIDGEL